ncbi:hypothetical protein D9615_007339 [Tricholomella constricta]|uniref:F-box domain-containing protein n=1 Tax=Tricholomella constricta TaxID=117010 RepID=A0A8H5M194_9AGAR|nr:hypothetical protein D9615_007339 [Tricholomella constricta]
MSQQYHTFDLNSMMYAMPTRGFIPVAAPVHRMPNEILGEIFDWLLRSRVPPLQPQARRTFTPTLATPMLVSHVCSHWRRVVLNIVSQWTYLEMNSTRHPDVFAELVDRSKKFPLGLAIALPTLNVELCAEDRQVEFRKTFKILKSHAARLRCLHIRTNNPTFFLIFSKYLKKVNFSALETLILEQVDPRGRMYHVGPVTFNPTTFRTLRLENIVIECDATCLASLQTLYLINSSGTLLDQTQLSHATYPLIPTAPTMTRLRDLKIDKTNIIPTTALPTPSFTSASLRRLHLARIRIPTEQAVRFVDRLLYITYTPLLEELILDDLDPDAFLRFMMHLEAPPTPPATATPKYARVRRLSLVKLNLAILNQNFMNAFPRVVELHLVELNPMPMALLLEDPAFMPYLTSFRVNHLCFRRVTIAPPGPPLALAPAPAPPLPPVNN